MAGNIELDMPLVLSYDYTFGVLLVMCLKIIKNSLWR